jgi:hypothetical protein
MCFVRPTPSSAWPLGRSANSAHVKLNQGLSAHPDHARYVACIIAQWNAIEDVATGLLSTFLGADLFTAAQIFAGVASGRRLELLTVAGRRFLAEQPLREEFDKLMADLGERLASRNDYAHALYGVDEAGTLTIIRRKFALTKPARAKNVLTLDELDSEWLSCIATFNRAIRFHLSLGKSLSSEHTEALHKIWMLQDGSSPYRMGAASRGDQPPPE